MGKRKPVNDFIVETNSQCFICFVKLEKKDFNCASVHSLQNLSHYLKLDMRKVFNEEELIPPHLLAQVEKSRLKVELCEGCKLMNETFSKQYKQLEKIAMDVKSTLKLMHGKFQQSMEMNKTAQFQNSEPGADDFLGKMEIANSLREEAMGKCKRKLGRPTPLVRILRMSKRKVLTSHASQPTKKFTPPSPFHGTTSGDFLKLDEDIEYPPASPTSVFGNDIDDRDNDLGNPNMQVADFEEEQNSSTIKTTGDVLLQAHADAQTKFVFKVVAKSASASTAKRCPEVIRSETGKYKCAICFKELKSNASARAHYRSIHLKEKYKCNLCGKEFERATSISLHHRSAHIGMRFKCNVCNKMFTSKQNLTKHQFKPCCKNEISQNIELNDLAVIVKCTFEKD